MVKTNKNLLDEKDRTEKRLSYYDSLEKYFVKSNYSLIEKLINFPKYVPNNMMAKFIVKYEIFKQCLSVPGDIIECGVFSGSGVMTFAHLSAILEPYNQWRSIIGFDTFTGFTNISKKDKNDIKDGGYYDDSYNDINESANILNEFRLLNRDKQVSLIRGDICKTIPKYIKENPSTVVSLLYLDCDLYSPTKTAIKSFIKRIPKGGIIAFDELHYKEYPGETSAVVDTIGINNLEIRRLPFTKISYAIIK